MVSEEQLRQWELQHQERINKLTNLNGPECRDCSPEHPCQVAALVVSHRSLTARLGEETQELNEARTALRDYHAWVEAALTDPRLSIWMSPLSHQSEATRAACSAAMAPGAGGAEEGS